MTDLPSKEKKERLHPWYVPHTYRLIKTVFGPLVRYIWVKEVAGIENLPDKGPVILAYNHQSFFDFISFIAVSPRPVHYLSAEKFFSNPFWLPFMKMTGQIKVMRTSHEKSGLHERVHAHLKDGRVIGIFPEGTRSPFQDEMLHAYTGVVKYAIRSEVPVIPVGIKGAFEVMSRHDKLPRLMRRISIHIGAPIYFTEHHGKELDEAQYRALTDKVMLEIARLSGKRYPHVGVMENPYKKPKAS